MTRHGKWQTMLENYLQDVRDTPFKYGFFDCCTFVADAISVMTGVDIARDYRGKYDSRQTAMDLAQQIDGGPSIYDVAVGRAQAFGLPEIPLTRASRGDMILLRRPRDYSLGILSLDGVRVLIAAKVGWGPAKTVDPVKAWRV